MVVVRVVMSPVSSVMDQVLLIVEEPFAPQAILSSHPTVLLQIYFNAHKAVSQELIFMLMVYVWCVRQAV
jgi:hypothetical protein